MIRKLFLRKFVCYMFITFVFALASMSFAEEGWTRKADMPTARWELSTCAVNGKIYAIGGRAGGQYFGIVEEYNPDTDTWTRKADMPTKRHVHSTSVVNGKIYAIGGLESGVPTGQIVEEYDPTTDTWVRKADILPGRYSLSTSVMNGKIYAIGGFWTSSIVEEYDPVTDTWIRKSDMPTSRGDLSTAVVNGKIYAIGGHIPVSPWSALSAVEEYDPATDTWTKKSDMPTARDALCTAVVDGIIYAIGGNVDYSGKDISVALLSTVEAYDPATDTWTKMPDIPTPRTGLSATSIRGMIYAIGGQPGRWPAVTDAVEAYSTGPWEFADCPNPADGDLHLQTWLSLNWTPGDFAVSHDVYFGDNFGDVNDGTGNTFRGNTEFVFIIAGLPGYPYPDGLVPGTTYYWRVDEVNDSHPESPWKGNIWSFNIPPKTAYSPVPVDGAESVDLNAELNWAAGLGATLHIVYFGESFEDVNNATGGIQQTTTTYISGPLKPAKTYYWRIDELAEVQADQTLKGDIWSFTTEGGVSGPNPANGAVDVNPIHILTWNAGYLAASHEVYFGTDVDSVRNATKISPEYKGSKILGEESFDPGMLLLETPYYWRIDEVNSIHPDSPWKGPVWNFTTGNFIVIDDFEDFDSGENRIWYTWHDGLGYGVAGSANYFAGNGTGSNIGDENTNSYTEDTIVHGGSQSMPVFYNNNQQDKLKYSEVEMTLSSLRDWTQQGVTELSLWFRGYPASVGSFVEGPAGTFTMTGSGADIWSQTDEFHFAYKVLSGAGSIIARIDSLQNTNNWAKAGVMIRETLESGSKHAFVYITPGNGAVFQHRATTNGNSYRNNLDGITVPHWIKLERNLSSQYTAYHSTDGSNWEIIEDSALVNIPMSSYAYIGLALTSHNDALTCQAKFSNVQIDGVVNPTWTNQDIGISNNTAEPLYVTLSNDTGESAIILHDDPTATNVDTWTEWNIDLSKFSDQGVDLSDVDTITIGFGDRNNPQPGGKGKMYFDDIRLSR